MAEFKSSPNVVRGFCGKCGTSLTYQADDFPDEIDITICSLDDPSTLPPKDHTQAAGKLRWTWLPEDLPVYPNGRPGRRVS